MADATAMRLATPRSSVGLLRAVFELVAARDQRIAPRLVVLSRAVHEWIDPILHHTITLTRASSTRALLRAIYESSKPVSFYAEHVKNLSISQEAHTEYLAQVLLVCTGITCLTFWSIPSPSPHSSTPSLAQEGSIYLALLGPTQTFQGPRLFLPQERTFPGDIRHPTFTDDCFNTICPRRLAASFRNDTHYQNSPDFSRPVFSYVTHLSIFNRSEEWADWDLGWYLPCLTHLALDLSKPSALTTHGTGVPRDSVPSSDGRTAQIDRVTNMRYLRMASMIKDVLHKSRSLCTVVVVIQFDHTPHTTMAALANSVLELEYEDSKNFPFNNPPTVPDPRLVFVQSTNPFAVRQAHGESEERMWRAAQRKSEEQRKWGRGPELLVM